jgi:hypothetical protein
MLLALSNATRQQEANLAAWITEVARDLDEP